MLWQSLDFWAWQNVTRDSEPWERDPAMSARFLEAICSFDQVVPEIGKKKSPCPMMVSDTIQKPRLVIQPSELELTFSRCQWLVWWVWWGPISPCQLRLWVMLMIRSHSEPRLESSWPLAIIAALWRQTGERCGMRDFFGSCRALSGTGTLFAGWQQIRENKYQHLIFSIEHESRKVWQ